MNYPIFVGIMRGTYLVKNNIKGLEVAVGRRLFIYDLQTDELHSVVLIEGYSDAHGFIYGRVERGEAVGTPIQGIPGDGAVYLLRPDLDAFEVICAVG